MGMRNYQTVQKPEAEAMLAVEKEAPRDRYNIVYYIMLLHGVGTLMPWNMFITIAPSYFVDYKLKEVGTDGVLIGTTYSLNFFSYLGICSQLPNLLTNLANVFIRSKGGLGRRIILSLITVALIIIITLVLVFIDTSHIVTTFFFLTMLTVIVLNAANGIYQNSIYGVVAAFPQQFTNAIVLGNNVCGTFVSIINIITLTALETVQIAASAYFLIALLTVTTCLVTFILLPRFEFYRYYMKKAEEEKEVVNLNEGESTTKVMLYWEVFKQVWVQCLNVFLVFFVTLSIFPAIMADTRIYRPNGVYDFWLPEFLFTPITTFLLFNLLAAIGSATANFKQWPSPRFLFIPVVLRIVLLPLMMFCNYRPNTRTWPIWITNEYVYIFLAIVMSFTSGYCSSLAMMYAPKTVDKSKAPIAGMMSAFFLITGICSGVAFTFFISFFIDSLGPDKVLNVDN